MATEVAVVDQPVFGTVKDRPPFLQFPNPVRGLLGMEFGHSPLVEELAPAHGVSKMYFPIVPGIHVPERGRDSTLRHHGMGLAEQGLRQQSRAQTLGSGLDGGSYASPASAHHQHVVLDRLQLGNTHSINPMY